MESRINLGLNAIINFENKVVEVLQHCENKEGWHSEQMILEKKEIPKNRQYVFKTRQNLQSLYDLMLFIKSKQKNIIQDVMDLNNYIYPAINACREKDRPTLGHATVIQSALVQAIKYFAWSVYPLTKRFSNEKYYKKLDYSDEERFIAPILCELCMHFMAIKVPGTEIPLIDDIWENYIFKNLTWMLRKLIPNEFLGKKPSIMLQEIQDAVQNHLREISPIDTDLEIKTTDDKLFSKEEQLLKVINKIKKLQTTLGDNKVLKPDVMLDRKVIKKLEKQLSENKQGMIQFDKNIAIQIGLTKNEIESWEKASKAQDSKQESGYYIPKAAYDYVLNPLYDYALAPLLSYIPVFLPPAVSSEQIMRKLKRIVEQQKITHAYIELNKAYHEFNVLRASIQEDIGKRQRQYSSYGAAIGFSLGVILGLSLIPFTMGISLLLIPTLMLIGTIVGDHVGTPKNSLFSIPLYKTHQFSESRTSTTMLNSIFPNVSQQVANNRTVRNDPLPLTPVCYEEVSINPRLRPTFDAKKTYSRTRNY